jgi:hypothetical protein
MDCAPHGGQTRHLAGPLTGPQGPDADNTPPRRRDASAPHPPRRRARAPSQSPLCYLDHKTGGTRLTLPQVKPSTTERRSRPPPPLGRARARNLWAGGTDLLALRGPPLPSMQTQRRKPRRSVHSPQTACERSGTHQRPRDSDVVCLDPRTAAVSQLGYRPASAVRPAGPVPDPHAGARDRAQRDLIHPRAGRPGTAPGQPQPTQTIHDRAMQRGEHGQGPSAAPAMPYQLQWVQYHGEQPKTPDTTQGGAQGDEGPWFKLIRPSYGPRIRASITQLPQQHLWLYFSLGFYRTDHLAEARSKNLPNSTPGPGPHRCPYGCSDGPQRLHNVGGLPQLTRDTGRSPLFESGCIFVFQSSSISRTSPALPLDSRTFSSPSPASLDSTFHPPSLLSAPSLR